MFYAFFRSFIYRGKAIVKDLSNIIGTGYNTPLSRESATSTLNTMVFREIMDFIPFHVFLMLFQFTSKYLA